MSANDFFPILLSGSLGAFILFLIQTLIRVRDKTKKIRGYAKTLLAEIELCGDYASTYCEKEYRAPSYRLPNFIFDNAVITLSSEGVIDGNDAKILTEFYETVRNINKTLDEMNELIIELQKPNLPHVEVRLNSKIDEWWERNLMKARRISDEKTNINREIIINQGEKFRQAKNVCDKILSNYYCWYCR